MPPTPNGAYNLDLLATCASWRQRSLPRRRAQAVAAWRMALATSVRRHDRRAGQPVVPWPRSSCSGRSRSTASPAERGHRACRRHGVRGFRRRDLLAQAEHDPGSSILITWHRPLVDAVEGALRRQLAALRAASRRGRRCRGRRAGAGPRRRAGDRVDEPARPEHLHIAAANAAKLADKIDNVGRSSWALHAGGGRRLRRGRRTCCRPAAPRVLRADCRRTTSCAAPACYHSPSGPGRCRDDVRMLAGKEGLTAHAASVDIRLK